VTREEIALASRTLEGQDAGDVLAWAAATLGPRIGFATGFGLEGLVLIDLIASQHLAIDIFTLDTGLLFPETVALWRQLEGRYGITIRAVRPAQTVEAQAASHGDALWSREPDRCCELRKVTPLRAELAGLNAWVTAIRRSQTEARGSAAVVEWDAKFGLVKVNPLAGWSSKQVWAHLQERGVPYNPLHDRGYLSIGCWPCTTSVADGEDPRAGRWRGTTKKECGLHLNPNPSDLNLSKEK
jgi:phosphoadenosine phosphosulfate reductase